ncbi:12431_t:CDS:2 [Acaulospora colombiana]|uniref:12431_t:CDS:1 n=1 Tax=Acaulospora colombiana TaxID=27376 RepID=A0ACA9K3G9_9GLOM|nr:12431_t:CDS:2 [Acaulospora colombiana]
MNPSEKKIFRVRVQKETIEAFTGLSYMHEKTKKVVKLDGPSIAAEVRKAKFYQDASVLVRERVTEKQEKSYIEVVEGDCLLEALRLKKQGFNPVVLNMASATSVGGGYKSGAGAQEENLFRRTNLFQYHEPNKSEWYPIPEFGGAYCPNATVVRSSEPENYAFLEVPETMSFVAVAALRRPKVIRDNSGEYTITPDANNKTRHKIRAILNIGLDNGHDAIVLSAFGCGAYKNPPKTIARLFYEVILTEYAGGDKDMPRTYKHISFAIIDDHNSKKKHNPEGNLYPFRMIFGNGGSLNAQGDNSALSPLRFFSNNRKKEGRKNNDRPKDESCEQKKRKSSNHQRSSHFQSSKQQSTLDEAWKHEPSRRPDDPINESSEKIHPEDNGGSNEGNGAVETKGEEDINADNDMLMG